MAFVASIQPGLEAAARRPPVEHEKVKLVKKGCELGLLCMYYLLNIIIVSAACYPGPILGHREKWSFRSKTNRDQLQLPQAKMSSVLLRQGLHIGGEIRSRLAIPLEYVRVIRDFYPTVTCAVVRQVRQGGKISFALCVTKTRTICQQES